MVCNRSTTSWYVTMVRICRRPFSLLSTCRKVSCATKPTTKSIKWSSHFTQSFNSLTTQSTRSNTVTDTSKMMTTYTPEEFWNNSSKFSMPELQQQTIINLAQEYFSWRALVETFWTSFTSVVQSTRINYGYGSVINFCSERFSVINASRTRNQNPEAREHILTRGTQHG